MALRIGFGIGLLVLGVGLAVFGLGLVLRLSEKYSIKWPREPIRTWEEFVSVGIRRSALGLVVLGFFVCGCGVALLFSGQ